MQVTRIPRGALTCILDDVLEAAARREMLECLLPRRTL
jgi:hypothetical protein